MTYQHAGPVRDRLSRLARVASDEFADILSDPPRVIGVRLRLYLVDGSFLDVRYPTDDEYSFHWQVEDKVYRINNAPHHPGPTFPRHVRMGTEENIVPDEITSPSAGPEENLKLVMKWIRKQVGDKTGTIRRKQMREASESTDRLRESSKTPGWSGAAEIRKWRDRDQRSKSLEKTKEREAAELSTIYGMGAQHKEKILEGIRELEREHDREARN